MVTIANNEKTPALFETEKNYQNEHGCDAIEIEHIAHGFRFRTLGLDHTQWTLMRSFN